MMTVCKQKKFKIVLLALLAFVFCAVSFLGFPVGIASAGTIEDDGYEAFAKSFGEMVEMYDVNNSDDGVAVASLFDEEEKPDYQTRLIVTSDKKIDDFGAVASCNYKNHYYFQYENYDDTDKAYEYFSSLNNVSVMYDYKTSINGDNIEIKASNYYSWGWNAQTDYLGANSYLTTILETVKSENFADQVVAVLDTGINPSHNLFKNRILTRYARNFTTSDASNYIDQNGHGTHVSGTIAEITPSCVYILPLRVLDAKGEGYVSYITNAIDYAIRAKDQIQREEGYTFKIMNMSLGITQTSVSQKSGVSANAISKANLSAWVEEAYSNGILSVVSAGNTETGGELISVSPANVAHAITVSALKRTNSANGAVVYDNSYSDYGPTVDFAAPGTSITSAGIYGANSTVTMSGTSMAAPHVTACVALIYIHPEFNKYSFEKLNTLLQENANRSLIYQNKYAISANAEKNDYYGYGVINIKNIGTIIEGTVDFDVENRFSDVAINVKLSTTISAGSGQTLEIYYTTDETIDSVSSANGIRYNSSKGINITKSTRILATAFVKQNEVVVKRSEVCTRVYYIGNADLMSRYKISGGVITQYTGTELTELVIPEVIGGYTVTGISNKAFNNSPVEVLTLPGTIETIGDNAFNGNAKLREIYCMGEGIRVGNYAFQRCTSLEVVEIPNIISLGQLAFAYSSIKDIELLNITTIGKNAFSAATSLRTMVIGKGILSIGTHTQMNLETVYGYAGTVAEDFANTMNTQFYDLTLRILQDLPNQKVVRQGSAVTFKVACAGFGVSTSLVGVNGANFSQSGDFMQTTVEINIPELQADTYMVKVDFVDMFGEEISSNVVKLIIVPKDTESYTLSYNDAEYSLYVDGALVTSEFELFKGQNYTIRYLPNAGYNINSVFVNEEPTRVNPPYTYNITNVNENISVKVNTIEQDKLTVNFTSEHGDIYIDGELLNEAHYTVDRYNSLTFNIVGDEGWIVKKVFVDNQELMPSDGYYTISNITSSKKVEVRYEEANYIIEITFVGSCGSYIVSGGGTLNSVAHGSSREVTISAFDGYAIDFVSINGKIVDVNNGKFVIDQIDADKEVVVSFKRQKTSIFARENSTILYYFIIFLVLFVLFVLGIAVMKIVRKRSKNQ